jgi:hypothetical protein
VHKSYKSYKIKVIVFLLKEGKRMASTYRAPGVDVLIERQQLEQKSKETSFLPVYIGTGITSRVRTIKKTKIKADVSAFPKVTLLFDLNGDLNTDMFNVTKFTLGQVIVTKSSGGTSTVVLEPGVGYSIEQDITLSKSELIGTYVLKILDATLSAADATYEINITAENTDDDFQLKLVGAEDRFFSKDLFGPIILEENGKQFFNDVAIAVEIAFRTGVQSFFYLEVPRNFGEQPTAADYLKAIEQTYYYHDAYRLVPLTFDSEVVSGLSKFVSGVSNPLDRRETVGFISYDPTNINSITDIDELVTKVGSLSTTINNKRICNVFGGNSVELTINNIKYELPQYFLNAAIASLDAVVGLVAPLSLREIAVFDKINGPRFRPRDWDKLAKLGVFIVKKDNDDSPAVIRHQLTTAVSEDAADQEYSVVKNFDVVTKKIRDRFKPYAGQYNIEVGYMERLDGTLATVRQEILENKLARSLTILTPWSISDSDGRNLVTRLQMGPVFPANHLDVYLVI